MKTYRLYVGANNETKTVDVEKLTALVSEAFEGFTMFGAAGFWQGEPEPSIMVIIATDEPKAKVTSLAKVLAGSLEQDAVGFEFNGEMEFIERA